MHAGSCNGNVAVMPNLSEAATRRLHPYGIGRTLIRNESCDGPACRGPACAFSCTWSSTEVILPEFRLLYQGVDLGNDTREFFGQWADRRAAQGRLNCRLGYSIGCGACPRQPSAQRIVLVLRKAARQRAAFLRQVLRRFVRRRSRIYPLSAVAPGASPAPCLAARPGLTVPPGLVAPPTWLHARV